MTAWKSDELAKIGAAEEVQIAPLRRDGTPQEPVTVWIVVTAITCTFDPSEAAAVIGSGVRKRGTRVGYGPVVFSKTLHSSTPATTPRAKSTLPTGPSTADTPEASSTAC